MDQTVANLTNDQPSDIMDLAQWLLKEGLQGASQEDVLQGYCERLRALNVPVMRVHVAQSAYHPRYGGVGFEWRKDTGVQTQHYAHTSSPVEAWLKSPLYHLLQTRETELRIRLEDATPGRIPFPLLRDLQAEGGTDYFAMGLLLTRPDPERDGAYDPENSPEGVLMSWTTDQPGGFSDADLGQLRMVLPYLGLALKSASNRKIAEQLLGVYLGADAGARVLSGEIARGSLQEIHAVICYFDLTGFTSLSEKTPGAQVIEALNDYFALVVAAIEGHGGHVLKFMGDGLLAMFDNGDNREDAFAALAAAAEIARAFESTNARRASEGVPVMDYTLALHAGELLYGNIGAQDRLDFTAIGPSVNLTARLGDMHRALGQSIILSQPVFEAAQGAPHTLVSLGRYALRGITEPQELYTIHQPGGVVKS